MEDSVAYTPAVPPAPTSVAPPAVRARLWLPGRGFAPEDDHPRLWLSLADGRVLALRLGQARLGDDAVIAPIVAALALDLHGNRYQLELAGVGFVQVLYAAPAAPQVGRLHAGFVFDAQFQHFVASLDAEVMRLLLSLERPPTPTASSGGRTPHPAPARYLASVRNYNRLATLPPLLRERRLQALSRFPALVAPLLLTLHHSPNLFDGKRHAWREKNAAVEAAIDAGQDLAGALARFWGVSRGLVRAPVNAAMWGGRNVRERRALLQLIDALPDNQRPDLETFERWLPYLPSYFELLGEARDDDDEARPLPQPPEVHRGAFRLGWALTWRAAADRHGNLLTALADCRDFLQAARERAAVLLARRYGPRLGKLAAGWLACHGLLGLLDASARWHRRQPRTPEGEPLPEIVLPEIVGTLEEDGQRAVELVTPMMLLHEGQSMHHCAGSPAYWEASVAGTRLFHLERRGERATAEYRARLREDVECDTVYRLVQLRGPLNREASPELEAWARRVEEALNAPEGADARWAALEARGRVEVALWEAKQKARRAAAQLDPKSERQLKKVLAWLDHAPPAPGVLLIAHVAGFQYHEGPRVEDEFAAGDALDLVLERDNPHDPLAVRIDWQGVKLGYVPRPENAEIAARLMVGEKLAARILEVDFEAEPWRRVEFVIEESGAGGSKPGPTEPKNLGENRWPGMT
ncbi:MAG: HIRAN domain-containing protein [Pseudomonadota bacterium]